MSNAFEPPRSDRRGRVARAPCARIFVALSALIAAWPGTLWCADSQVVVRPGGSLLEFRVTSLRAQRDAGVVKQRYDYSCGSASLATLLTYGLNDPVDEAVLLQALLEPLSADELVALEKKGLSLFDLQQLAQKRGHKAQGFRLGADQLPKIARPVIVFIRPHGYEHFAVLKGVRGDRAYLADPSQGNWTLPLYRFLDMWLDDKGQGVVFVVERKDGRWDDTYALLLPELAPMRPEVLSVREMLEYSPQITPPFRPQVPQ